MVCQKQTSRAVEKTITGDRIESIGRKMLIGDVVIQWSFSRCNFFGDLFISPFGQSGGSVYFGDVDHSGPGRRSEVSGSGGDRES